MKRIYLTLAMVATLLMSTTIFAQQVKKTVLPTGEQVLAKYVEKTGGAEKYKKIKSLQATGEMEMAAMGITGTVSMKAMMPSKASMVVDISGIGKQATGSNGEHFWSNSDMQGPRLLKGKEAEQIKDQVNMERYTDFKKVYKSVKNLGVEDVDGEDAYKVELVKTTGAKQTEFYSVKTGLLIKTIAMVEAAGMGELEIASRAGDYRPSDDELKILMPHKMSIKTPVGEQTLTFSKYQYNVKLDSKTFNPPAEVQKLIDEKKAEEKID